MYLIDPDIFTGRNQLQIHWKRSVPFPKHSNYRNKKNIYRLPMPELVTWLIDGV